MCKQTEESNLKIGCHDTQWKMRKGKQKVVNWLGFTLLLSHDEIKWNLYQRTGTKLKKVSLSTTGVSSLFLLKGNTYTALQ